MPKDQIEAKLDLILLKLDGLTDRVDRLEKTVTSIQHQVSEVEAKLSKRCENIELFLAEKVENSELINLKKQVKVLEKQRDEEHEVLVTQQTQITQLKGQLQQYKQVAERESLSREAYSKKFNLLVHGLDEDQNSPWENRATTESMLKKFLKDGLQIENPDQISIIDVHRLPQYPLFKNKVKINRPIIFKLAGNNDKQMIMHSLKNLRRYNETRLEENSKAGKVYVTEHLPKPLYLQKKQLLPHYKKARSENKRASWCIQDGEYCLYVDGEKIIA